MHCSLQRTRRTRVSGYCRCRKPLAVVGHLAIAMALPRLESGAREATDHRCGENDLLSFFMEAPVVLVESWSQCLWHGLAIWRSSLLGYGSTTSWRAFLLKPNKIIDLVGVFIRQFGTYEAGDMLIEKYLV